ncbi:MAG: hypothetical protein AUG48_04070 [Actinobacteria bacterium 13_1_20CM_3_68_9]|nr:MAG: hypothetical protein AUG48_04070 [Actinobacteria bacterium 13_1_20CM_3_68_9]
MRGQPRSSPITDHAISRRRLLGASAAAGLGTVLERVPGARAAGGSRRSADVAVVGAGFAGLTAALRLVEAGRSVIVLEARGRVGGRALNRPLGGGEVSERGATFAGPTQDHILALAKQFGVGKFPTFDEGNNVYINAKGMRSTYSDSGPLGTAPPDPALIPDITQAVTRLDQMSTKVPVDAPWHAASANDWDQQTLESWVRANSTNPQFRKIVSVATRPIFGAEPRELSLLFVLFYIAASGNEQNVGTFERNFNTRGGAQMWRFVGGAQLLCQKVARRLGTRVVLDSPVERIAQNGSGVIVHSQQLVVDAKRVIVAIPPTLAGRIDYQPELPAVRDQLTQRLPQGTLIKAAAVYDTAFWRGAGLNGTAISIPGPVNATLDNARNHMAKSLGDRKAAVVNQFVKFFGAKAAHPRSYFETNWSREEWTRGCPVAIAGPGTLLAYGPALRRPVGRIHWAGTETSTFWNGYMDGAVRSGERATQEVLDRL